MAAIAAIHDVVKLLRAGRAPTVQTVADTPGRRVQLLREGLNATARIILLGLAMDLIYQLLVFKAFYPVEALIIAVLLAFVPYLLVRVLLAPIARQWRCDVSARAPR
jgi:hypothetical protein